MTLSSYIGHFGLSGAAFSKEVPVSSLWVPPSKRRVLDEVKEAVSAREQVLLVGEPGVGKTCLMRALREEVCEPAFRLTYCHNATLGRRDFYRALCQAIGLSPSATAAAVFFALSTHVESLAEQKSHPVFLLDEAHLLHQDVLDHLHILLNYQWDSKALLSLVLIGLPELQDRLSLRKNRSLYTRIHHRLRMESWPQEDTEAYMSARLTEAGAGGRTLFAPEAVTQIHEMCTGSLREIDRLARGGMRVAASKKAKVIESKHVKEANSRHLGE